MGKTHCALREISVIPLQHSKSKKSHKHSKSIEELRRERKKREEAERIRTTALLSGALPESNPDNHGDVSSSGR